MTSPLTDRLALVTGASRGIGHAVALALAKAGAHVIAVARTVGGLEELDDEITKAGGTATLVPLDLKDYDGIARLGGALFDRYKKLDILVGNAGILGPLSPLSHVEPKAWDEVMAVNVTANWHLIRCMEPLLLKSDAGRAVFLTTGGSWQPRAYWGPYAVSKAALNTMVRTWAAETTKTSLRVNLFTPGPIRTRMRAQAMPGEDPMTLETPEQVAGKIVEMCLPSVAESGKVYAYPVKRMLTFRTPD
ncbi:MAG: SDR family NAD(P)-dependent oxidoreductase [Pseudorhodoplanes sp.]|jgi:NAD(P)-dependent dehydrogenase (short-subunit alcohol dehydrogenase family)